MLATEWNYSSTFHILYFFPKKRMRMDISFFVCTSFMFSVGIHIYDSNRRRVGCSLVFYYFIVSYALQNTSDHSPKQDKDKHVAFIRLEWKLRVNLLWTLKVKQFNLDDTEKWWMKETCDPSHTHKTTLLFTSLFLSNFLQLISANPSVLFCRIRVILV